MQLSLMMSLNDRSAPVLDGTVQPEGIELLSTVGHPSEIFWRQLHFQEFDVSEMSLSSLLMAIAQGNRDWVGLPVFTSRRFFHTGGWARCDAGIDGPRDLRGKRVGVPEFQQTAALWSRGALKHEFGVDQSELEWFMERTPARSHGGATGFTPPPGLRFSYIPPDENIGTMMMSGELDATLLYIAEGNLVDRSRVRFEGNPRVKRLFPDPVAEGRRYFGKTGLFPINHGMVVRRSIYEQDPSVAPRIVDAFEQAKRLAAARALELAATHLTLGLLPDGSAEALARDPYPYGVRSNRQVLETVCEYSHEQGLTPRRLALEEVFAPNTMEL